MENGGKGNFIECEILYFMAILSLYPLKSYYHLVDKVNVAYCSRGEEKLYLVLYLLSSQLNPQSRQRVSLFPKLNLE